MFAGKVFSGENCHSNVIKRYILDRFIRHSLDQTVSPQGINADITKHHISNSSQFRRFCSRFNIHKNGICAAAPAGISHGKFRRLYYYVRELNVLIASPVLHKKGDSILSVSYHNIVENTMLNIPHRTGTKFYS
ncbi:hypothetical protein ES703_104492 [subsurface metagenome]